MGRRSINTTKSGKYMNPTDQARKEARKRELKKNKKQRMMVRMAVLKGKDPLKLIEEMEVIDKMEYDPTQPPKLNERVLKDKRKKLKETFDRVLRMYEREEPEYAMDLRKNERQYEKKRSEKLAYFEQVRNAEKVQLDQIPLPDLPIDSSSAPSMIPLPGEIPLPGAFQMQPPDFDPLAPRGILKKAVTFDRPPDMSLIPPPGALPARSKKPPGPPPGTPPLLSSSASEDEEMAPDGDASRATKEMDQGDSDSDSNKRKEKRSSREQRKERRREREERRARRERTRRDDRDRSEERSRRIRFEDDETHDPDAPEKDTRLKYKPAVSALQVKMLQMAGQEIPMVEEAKRAESESRRREAEEDVTKEDDDDDDSDAARKRRSLRHSDSDSTTDSDSGSDSDSWRDSDSSGGSTSQEEGAAAAAAAGAGREAEREAERRKERELQRKKLAADIDKLPDGPPGVAAAAPTALPPGPPPGLPPGPPSGPPPMMFRPPPLRPPPGAPPRMLPPGPPPGRPPGIPPGPPPGLPPNMRGMPPRLPPGPPSIPPPRLMRPPGAPPGMAPPGAVTSGSLGNPNVLSAPPSIMKRPQKSRGEEARSTATIEAKPQIKNVVGEVTRFMPTSLKIKRTVKDAKGRIVKQPAVVEEPTRLKAEPAVQAQTKDDAYDSFMREMEDLL